MANISAIREAKNQQIKLRQKLSILQSPEVGISKSDLAYAAIPSENPSLIALSQIRTIASTTGLSLTSFSVSQPVKVKNLWKITISFDVDGNMVSIFNFLDVLSNSAPVLTVEKYKLATNGQEARANIGVNYYWSPLPKQIPPISESTDFTKEELETLDQMTKLTSPPKTAPVSPIIRGSVPVKENPFE